MTLSNLTSVSNASLPPRFGRINQQLFSKQGIADGVRSYVPVLSWGQETVKQLQDNHRRNWLA